MKNGPFKKLRRTLTGIGISLSCLFYSGCRTSIKTPIKMGPSQDIDPIFGYSVNPITLERKPLKWGKVISANYLDGIKSDISSIAEFVRVHGSLRFIQDWDNNKIPQFHYEDSRYSINISFNSYGSLLNKNLKIRDFCVKASGISKDNNDLVGGMPFTLIRVEEGTKETSFLTSTKTGDIENVKADGKPISPEKVVHYVEEIRDVSPIGYLGNGDLLSFQFRNNKGELEKVVECNGNYNGGMDMYHRNLILSESGEYERALKQIKSNLYIKE